MSSCKNGTQYLSSRTGMYNVTQSDSDKQYTRAQLALRNGTDRDEIWCAYAGIIYDVSSSRLWRNGNHYEHWAGQDLTAELADAPHSDWVFAKFPVVGWLV